MSVWPTVLTITGLTLREAARRRVLWALGALTVVLLGLSGWGLTKLADVATQAGEASGQEFQLVASMVLNLLMFGLSLIAALGTAFLAGPTLAGEVESGLALAVLARPVRRGAVLFGKWLGLAVFGCGYVAVAGLLQLLVVRWTAGFWPPAPAEGLALLAAQTVVLLTLALLLSSVISPLASGIVSVGLFGSAWVAGIVGGIGRAIGNSAVERIGTISRVILPTDGLWRGAMHAFQAPSVTSQPGFGQGGFPFFGDAALTAAYLGWAAVWVLLLWGATAASFGRRDL
jgi:ABC-type transport system involved in multi-copper enzyme maturation permease subunit